MKLMIVTLHDTVEEEITRRLTSHHFKVTVIASTSGWLRKGMKTLLIGADDEKVQDALSIIRQNCSKPAESKERCATIFVLKVHEYIHF